MQSPPLPPTPTPSPDTPHKHPARTDRRHRRMRSPATATVSRHAHAPHLAGLCRLPRTSEAASAAPTHTQARLQQHQAERIRCVRPEVDRAQARILTADIRAETKLFGSPGVSSDLSLAFAVTRSNVCGGICRTVGAARSQDLGARCCERLIPPSESSAPRLHVRAAAPLSSLATNAPASNENSAPDCPPLWATEGRPRPRCVATARMPSVPGGVVLAGEAHDPRTALGARRGRATQCKISRRLFVHNRPRCNVWLACAICSSPVRGCAPLLDTTSQPPTIARSGVPGGSNASGKKAGRRPRVASLCGAAGNPYNLARHLITDFPSDSVACEVKILAGAPHFSTHEGLLWLPTNT